MNWAKLQANSIYYNKPWRQLKKKKKRSKNNKNIDWLQHYANQLNANVPQSEIWFRDLYLPNKYDIDVSAHNDRYNVPVGKYIVDMLNSKFMYAVEIDGSIHNTPEQKLKDAKKTVYLMRRGYTVIRITAYDAASYASGLKKILDLRNVSASTSSAHLKAARP